MNNYLIIDNTLLLNGTDITIYSLSLPKLNPNHLIKAIPFALEEHLVDELDQLYFSFVTEPTLQVAVVKKSLLNHVLNNHNNIEKIIPNYLALPLEEKSWSILIHDTLALVRISKNTGFSIELNLLSSILEKTYDETSENSRPERINIYQYEISHSLTFAESMNHLIHLCGTPSFTAIEGFRQGLLESVTDFNLLPKEHRPKANLTQAKKYWLSSSILAMSAFLIFVIGDSASSFYLASKSRQQTETISRYYFSLFPESTAVVAPEWRVSQLLNSLKARHEENGFLTLLQRAYPALSGHKVLELSFENAQLSVKLEEKNFTVLQDLIIMLKNNKLNVEQNSTNANHIITTKLILSEA
ncbi:MAG: type II secretion system protein GspL [Gammaproteobacteria bacterium]